jgi:hypothetical protein
LEEGWPGVSVDDAHRIVWDGGLTRADGWPSVEGGVEVVMEVCSDAQELQRGHSACMFLWHRLPFCYELT